LKNVLTQPEDTLLKNRAASLANHQSLLSDESALSSLMQSLITRLSALHLQNKFSNLNHTDNTSSFKLDIPLWIADPFSQNSLANLLLTIEKDKQYKKNDGKNTALSRRWRIMMEFDLGTAGKLEAEALMRESRVNISLWAEEKQTQDKVQSSLQSLSEQLIKKGVPVEGIHCRLDKPGRKPSHHPFSLINVRG
jgi:hypothetical protein